jgi:hypothetical protein
MELDVQQSAVLSSVHLRHASNRLRIQYTVANDSKATLSLGDQHATVWKKRQAPWYRQSLGDGDDANRAVLGVYDQGVLDR